MNRTSFAIACALAAYLGAGCESAVVIDLPEHESQLVVQSLFTPDSAWSALVTFSVGYTEARDEGFVDDATVAIYEGGDLLETLVPLGSGRYQGATTRPQQGRTYTLRASAPGFDAVEAEASLPFPPTVVGVTTTRIPDPFGNDQLEVTLTLRDPERRANYYALGVLRRITQTFPDGTRFENVYYSGFRSSDPILLDVDPFEDGEAYYEHVYFSDLLFDGEETDLTIRIESSLFPGHTSDRYDANEAVFLRLYTTERAYYDHFRSLLQQEEFGDNPFAEPVQILSNVSNGFGLFAGYHLTTVRVDASQD